MAPEARRAQGADGGFSMIEVVIAATILFLIIGIAARTISSGQGLLVTCSAESSGDVVAQTLASQIADRIRNGIVADVEDGSSAPLADGATCTDGIRVRLLKSFRGGAEKGKTVWISVQADEPNVSNGVDDDRDGVWDERKVRIYEFPADDDDVGATATDLGTLGRGLGLIRITSPVASAGLDRRGVLDPTDTTVVKQVVSPLSITRTGDSLRITVGVLRRDPVQLDRNRRPLLRSFMATTYVTLRN